jgi:hypothetical protein
LPGVLHVGELHYLWRNGVLKAGTNSSCGCGLDLSKCDLWSSILDTEDAFGQEQAAQRQTALQHQFLRTRHTRTRLAEACGRRPQTPGVAEAVQRTVAVYHMLSEQGGDRLIVDGSKYPAEAATLLGRNDLDVRILHMVRDPRPTAFSYKRAKDYIDPMSPARSSAYWTAFNVASELVGRDAKDRYLRIRHEDLCRDPRQVVAQIMRFAGLHDEPAVDDEGKITLSENHTVTGNPDRLSNGNAVIRPDERWRTGLTPREIAAATGPALPLLSRYGYPLAPSR